MRRACVCCVLCAIRILLSSTTVDQPRHRGERNTDRRKRRGKKERVAELESKKEDEDTSPSFSLAHSILAGKSARSGGTGMKCSYGTSHGVKNSAKAVDCAEGGNIKL